MTSDRPRVRRRGLSSALLALVALAACSGSESDPFLVSMDETTDNQGELDAVAADDRDVDPAASAPAPSAVDGGLSTADLERFVASAESAIVGTASEGVVFETPEIYIAIAQSACARFSGGDDFGTVAAGLVSDLAPDEPSVDDQRLAGAILGSATRTICPEHADQVVTG